MTTHSSVGENTNTGWHEMFTVHYKVYQKKAQKLYHDTEKQWRRTVVWVRTVTPGDMKCLLSATRCTKKKAQNLYHDTEKQWQHKVVWLSDLVERGWVD